jgi:lysozyme
MSAQPPGRRHVVRRLLLAALLLVALPTAACGADPENGESAKSGSATSTPSPTPAPTSTTPTPEPATGTPASPTPTIPPPPTPAPRTRPLRGVDASHHQGQIDWVRVGRDRISFAYLKATEGSTFTDPRFVDNAKAARQAGLRVGGYHYFSLCSSGAPQAEHFADVLGSADAGSLPPAIDLELIGNCADPPARDDLLREVRAFVDIVERRVGQRIVVYAYPEFEQRFRIATALQRRQWVRSIGSAPPAREWWIWQQDDHAAIEGISGPADLNLMAP